MLSQISSSYLYIILICVFAASKLFSQSALTFGNSEFAKFEHISDKQKLSHNTVTGIIQDKEGFLWFATIDGLNKFDGYSCKVYKHSENDTASISDNFLHDLIEDSEGNIWIATRNGGLNKFDKKTEIFKHYKNIPGNNTSLSSNVVKAVYEDRSGRIWIATESGLNSLDPVTEIFDVYKNNPDDPYSLSNDMVNSIMQDSEGFLWVTTYNGLNKFDPNKKIFTRYLNNKSNQNTLSENFTTYLHEDEEEIIWIGTKGGGLSSFIKKENKFARFNELMLRQNIPIPSEINNIVSYDNNNLLIGTDGTGLLVFNKTEKTFKSIRNDQENSSSISNDIVTAIYKDNQNIFWIGTWGGGINKLIDKKKKFDHYPINSSSVFALLKDNENNIWIGGKIDGLLKLNQSTMELKLYKLDAGQKNEIRAIHDDKEGNLWIAVNGLIKFNKATGDFITFKHFPSDKNGMSSNDIKFVTSDSKGNIWIGTEDKGASKYNPPKKEWTNFLFNEDNPPLVRTIYEDSKGNIWFGTYRDGLIKLDPISNSIIYYRHENANPSSISSNDVRHITETKNGELWVATYGGGINKFDPTTEKFYVIKESDGLSNNFTYGILEDDDEQFWISTNHGLTKFERKNNHFKIYTQEDGLQNNEFNTGAFYKSKDGELFFGGVNGFNGFYPENILDNQHIPHVYLTSFKIFDKEVKLDTVITFKKNIELAYSDKFFSFDFAALDYSNPEKNQYAYMLEGFDSDWIKSGDRRFASYTNLDPGKYNFRIIASNNDGVWNNEGAIVKITVASPFWMTWWFKTVVILFLVTLLAAVVRYYSTYKLKKKIRALEKEQAVRKERERISRDLHDNVGSQLTFLISTLDNLAYSEGDTKHSKKIKDVSSYGRKTIKELRNTIWAMKNENIDVTQLILKLNELKQEVNGNINNLYLEVYDNTSNQVSLSTVQTLSLYRVVQEAVQNIIKHSGADKADVIFDVIGEKINMQINDNGKGFDLNERKSGNGITNMKQRCEEAGGEFNINTSGEGTRINCSFKIGQMPY